ncbi:MAG TPA: PqqD family protein [Pyrinomonadaceae bacterium]|nr:PqqD family protein [Pyrinomonadaceae bacterium]
MKPNPNVLFKRLGDEMVLFNLDTDHFYELNATAARFWELLSAGHDSLAVREHMLQEFAVDPEKFASEAETLVASLQKENLVCVDE